LSLYTAAELAYFVALHYRNVFLKHKESLKKEHTLEELMLWQPSTGSSGYCNQYSGKRDGMGEISVNRKKKNNRRKM
jgi:hypothetical protein